MPKDKKLDSNEAKRILQEENKAKIQACSKEVQEVLDKHGCMLTAGMLISAQGNRPLIEINVKPE